MSEVAKRVLWARLFLSRIQGLNDEKDSTPVLILHGDNSAAVTLTKGLNSTFAIRYIATGYHYILHGVKMGTVITKWVPSNEMLADGLTKPLGRIVFMQKRKEVGVSSITEVMEEIL